MNAPDRYLERIESALPDLTIASIQLNREGMVNDVAIVNDELVFRFPKSDWGRQALAHEAQVLDVVRDRVNMPVPRIRLLADDMSCHRLVPGEPLDRDVLASLPAIDRRAVLEQLGAFLWALHEIDTRSLDGVQPSDAVRTRDDWLAFARRVEEVLFPLLMRYQRDWVTRHFAPIRSGELDLDHEPALIHGDLAPYHVLYDPVERRIAGIIDFGTAGIGDPAIDVACLIYQYGESIVRELAPHYPAIETCIDRARFWAGTLELQWALTGILNDDRSLLVAHIGSARDAQAIGSPLDPDR